MNIEFVFRSPTPTDDDTVVVSWRPFWHYLLILPLLFWPRKYTDVRGKSTVWYTAWGRCGTSWESTISSKVGAMEKFDQLVYYRGRQE